MTSRTQDPFQTISDCEDWTNRLLEMDRQTGISRSAPMAYSEEAETLVQDRGNKGWGIYIFLVGMAAAHYLITQPLLNSSTSITRWMAGLTVSVLSITVLIAWLTEQFWRQSNRPQASPSAKQPGYVSPPRTIHLSKPTVWHELSDMLGN